MITRDEVLMGRDKQYPLTPELESNLQELLRRLNMFRQMYARPMVVSSGYRPSVLNEQVGGAKNSAHMTCEACDFHDSDKQLRKFILEDPNVLEVCDLYCEDFRYTPTWVHLQTRRVKSGKRIFKP
jgi:hypothetical protein